MEYEIKKLWGDRLGKLAQKIEKALDETFEENPIEDIPESHLPEFKESAIAMAAGYYIQKLEKQYDIQFDLKPLFDSVLTKTYDFYKEHEDDEEIDGEEFN